MISLLVAAGSGLPPTFEFDVRSGTGLTLKLSGVPVIRGTWFQYYDTDVNRGLYNSSITAQQVERLTDGVKVRFRSSDGRAFGTQTYTRNDNRLKIQYEFNWSGEQPVRVELAAGMMWARVLQGGTLTVDNHPTRSLARRNYDSDDLEPRKYGDRFSEAVFQSALGRVSLKGSTPDWTLFDGRGYKQSWADGRDLFFFGQRGVEVKKGTPAKFELEYAFEPNVYRGGIAKRTAPASPMSMARYVNQNELPILPRPKQALFDRNTPFVIGNELRIDIPDRLAHFKKDLLRAIQRSWIVPDLKAPTTTDPNIYCRIENIGLPPEGFEIRANTHNIIVWGQDEAGLTHGLMTLGSLAFAKSGQLCFPSGTMRDWPSMGWRGVHLFGGPDILAFHSQLAERVLMPMRINHVVVECERTRWKSMPQLDNPLWNSTEDLKATFEMYRNKGIDPIPLIQSLGHMEWLLSNPQNSKFAVNPDVPYTLDPRKPGAQELIQTVWNEALLLLKPKTVHFGLDEIDNRGMVKDAATTTELWEKMVPNLGVYAARNGVQMMLWGDKCLAPSQAVDAAHGDDPANAKRRRDAIPKGALIGDWHYKNDRNPDRFMMSMGLWKDEGFFPIGSGWFNRDNIANLSLAGYKTGTGYLQTTWAGYEANEENMHREYRQYAAYILAADYAWSGRTDDPNQLDYDPAEILGHLLYTEPSPLTPANGTALEGPRPLRIGDLQFRLGEPYALVSALTPGSTDLPGQIDIETPQLKGHMLGLALDTAQICEDRDPVADVTIELASGKLITKRLLYGVHVRAASDRRPIFSGPRADGVCAQLITLGEDGPIRRISLAAASTYAGLRLLGATAY